MNRQRADFVGPTWGVRRDTDLAFALTWTYAGVGIDLTGHTLEWKFRAADESGAPLLILDNAGHGGITIADQSLFRGRATYVLTQSQIASTFLAGIYSHSARDLTGGGIGAMFIGLIEFLGPAS